jgi:hypothetical protein
MGTEVTLRFGTFCDSSEFDKFGVVLEGSAIGAQKTETDIMVKNVATYGGLLLVVAGLIGLVAPGLIGMQPSAAHNIVHILSGALALYFGLKI